MAGNCFGDPEIVSEMTYCLNLLPADLRDVVIEAAAAGHEKLSGSAVDCSEIFAVASACLDLTLPDGKELRQLLSSGQNCGMVAREQLLKILHPFAAALICSENH